MTSMLQRAAFLGAALLTAVGWAEDPVVPLSEARTKLVLPNYSADEKQTLADQAYLLMNELFVHRELKIQQFGATADPLPRLERIRRQARDLSPEALHRGISETFVGLHDLHTNYLAPAPLSCGLAFVPIRFQAVRDGNTEAVIASQKLKLQEELVQDIKVGDRLLEVDGRPVDEVLADLSVLSGGANPDAMRVRATQMLSFRNPAIQPLPAKDKISLKLEGADGEYTKEIPWMTLLDQDCLDSAVEPEAEPLDRAMDKAEDDFQKRFNQVFGQARLPSRPMNARTANGAFSEVFDVALLTTPAGRLGYVRLKKFSWSARGLDTGTVIEGLRRSIEGNFAEAAGMIIDVRGNPGGLITLSEKLVQLFSHREVEPTQVRMLAGELNQEIFRRANGQDNRWSLAVREAMQAGKKYAGPLAITPHHEANDMGQIWFRPVIVLTDASCYSACDLFVAGMRDSGAGTVIGLHRGTGGGGANVMEYNTFRSIFGAADANNPFKALPRKQNMRVSWRQSVRTGLGAGKLIEGAGVESDIIVPLSRKDIGTESKELMSALHRILGELGPKYTSGLGVRRGGVVMLKNGDSARWTERVYGLDSIEILVDGRAVASVTVQPSDEAKDVELSVIGLKGEWRDRPVVVVGKRNGQKKFRAVRELKWRGDYTPVPADGIELKLSESKLEPMRTVLLHGPANSGWQVVEGALRVGKGPKYENSVHTRAFLPLALEGNGGRVTLDLKLDAESLHDALRIYLINPDSGERGHVYGGSRIPESKGIGFRLPLGWARADVVFEFESDENWTMEGPVISKLKVARATETGR